MAAGVERIHADMRACEPKGALRRECAEGAWLLVDYETAYGLKGVMVYSDPKLNSARLELPLRADGLYKVFLGINYTKSPYGMVYSGYSGYGNLEVKLSNDLGFTRVAAEPAGAQDPTGPPGTKLSLAYPEVREYWISLMREALDYGLDGLVVYLNRFKPFVLYEEPTVRSFREKYGEDPRELPEDDPRWIAHGADYVTTFLKEIRALLDERPGRELGVVHYGGPSQYDKGPGWHPIHYHCDVERWITEGLVDYLFPTQYPLVELIEKWSELAAGRVKIHPDLMPASQAGEDFAKQARIYYEAGADGICLRDGERRSPHLTEWAVQCRLGHRDRLEYLERAAPSYYRRVPLKTLNGFATRYSYNNFGSLDPLLIDESR